jgi:hypothetical protein
MARFTTRTGQFLDLAFEVVGCSLASFDALPVVAHRSRPGRDVYYCVARCRGILNTFIVNTSVSL